MHTQLNLDALRDVNSVVSIPSIDALKLLPIAEQKAQMAFFLGYLDNLAGAYSKASPEMQKKILSTLTTHVYAYYAVAQTMYLADPTHNSDLFMAYTTLASKFGSSSDPAQLMKDLESCDTLTRGYALNTLTNSTFAFDNNSNPTTLALFAEFMGSRNNNPSETTDIPVLEGFLGQVHAGVDCGSFLASFCNNYLQAPEDRDLSLFPTSTDDPQGFALFKNTFRAATNPGEEVNYSKFFQDLMDTIGTPKTEDPTTTLQKMVERGWLDASHWNPSTVELTALKSELVSVDFSDVDFLNITTDSSNDGSDVLVYPDSSLQRI
jgi:hypothetical protein